MLSQGLSERLRDLRSSFVGLGDYMLGEARHGRELRRYCKGKSGLLLNIGCGRLTADGWVNVDYQPIQGRSFYLDVRNGKARFAIKCSEWVDITSSRGISKPYSLHLTPAVFRMPTDRH
jgi:hypothetical protein